MSNDRNIIFQITQHSTIILRKNAAKKLELFHKHEGKKTKTEVEVINKNNSSGTMILGLSFKEKLQSLCGPRGFLHSTLFT